MMKHWYLFPVILLMAACPQGFCQDDEALYRQGLAAAAADNPDFAFISFDTLVKTFPESPHRPDAFFAIAEYYSAQGAVKKSAAFFNQACLPAGQAGLPAGQAGLDTHKDFPGRLFAFARLYQFADPADNGSHRQEVRDKMLAGGSFSLLFRDYKELKFQSALGNKYLARYFIDRIEFFVNGKPFVTIPLGAAEAKVDL